MSKNLAELVGGFLAPPDSAKPRVWWHWMNGNITKEGIQKDLDWMKRIGIGGVQNFDGALETPQIVNERLIYMTPPWQDAFRYATLHAEELGLEFAIASSPGWSETGGPWVEPRDGMKKLVWSETRLAGGTSFRGRLTTPPSVAGPFQSIPLVDPLISKTPNAPDFYQDVLVLAFRTPDRMLNDPEPIRVTTSPAYQGEPPNLHVNITQPIALAAKDKPAWALYDYGAPMRFRAVSLTRPSKFSMTAFEWVVEASTDGKTFLRAAELPRDYTLHRTTVAFPQVTARYLRLTITPVPLEFWFDFAANAPGTERPPVFAERDDKVEFSELRFYAGARVHRFEEKAAFAIASKYYALDGGANDADEAVPLNDVIDVSDKMSADGTFDWTPPGGNWSVLRLGYSLTGKTNHPASPEATGLEVDKLDRRAVKAYVETYLDTFEKVVGADWIGKKGIRAFITDSIETGGQNWTPDLMRQFRARRGYDLSRWLPTLTGMIIGDSQRTDRFLWDFRKTLMELISEAHYGQIAESVHARGLLYYSESLEGHPSMSLGDDLDMRAHADIPMAAIWTNYKSSQRDGIRNHIGDILGAASIAHVLGKTLVAAESLTSGYEPWAFSPATLRPVIDLAFALGVNRPVIHTSVHQPGEKKPGMTLGFFGQHFTRHETWGEMAEAWITYLSRSAYLLQQGKPVADVAWFYGEEGSLAGLYADGMPADLPDGHGFDFVNAKILQENLKAENGRLVSSGGATYRLLYLGGSSTRMTLSVLRKLKALHDQGVLIAGQKPVRSPSLADDGHEPEYERLVEDLWGNGKIATGGSPNKALQELGVARDFAYTGDKPDTRILFLHRGLPQAEVYFLTNRRARPERIEARFRVTGMRPQLWHADSGEIEPVSWRIEGNQTVISISLYASQSVFVVFGEFTQKNSEEATRPIETDIASLDDHWQLRFEPGGGAPTQSLYALLECWTRSSDAGVRYFSGIGNYARHFVIGTFCRKATERVVLDLGEVHELAEVTLNGKYIGTTWHAPFRLDVTDAIKEGYNTITVRVANLWVNRLIGDKQPGATSIAFTVTTTYDADAPLRPSGLIGPVKLKLVTYDSPNVA